MVWGCLISSQSGRFFEVFKINLVTKSEQVQIFKKQQIKQHQKKKIFKF
jgi:hypothetical protein